jgi:hypothetical protein
MNMELLEGCKFIGETEVLGENLPQYHFAHHKFHITWPGIQPEPPRWEPDDEPPELRNGPSSAFDVRYFRNAECDTDRYLVTAKVRVRRSGS